MNEANKISVLFNNGKSEVFKTKLPLMETLKKNDYIISTYSQTGNRVLINLKNVAYIEEFYS